MDNATINYYARHFVNRALDLNNVPAEDVETGNIVTLNGRYLITDYTGSDNQVGVFYAMTEEDAIEFDKAASHPDFDTMEWNYPMYMISTEDLFRGIPEATWNTIPKPANREDLEKQWVLPSTEHPLGPHTGNYKLDPLLQEVLEEQMREGGVPEEEIKPSISDIIESMNDKLQNKDNHKVISMDKNADTGKYEHKFDKYKKNLREKGKKHHHGEIEKESGIERSSIPAEHLAARMTPEELDALLAGGEGKGWTDVPEAERPHGWAEEMIETPEGTEYKRVIDPDLERGDKEDANAKAHGLANKPFPTQGIRGASTKTSFSDTGWSVVQWDVSPEDPYRLRYIHLQSQDGSEILANNVNIDLGQFNVTEHSDTHGLPGGPAEYHVDVDRGRPEITIESVQYSEAGDVENPDATFTGEEIPAEILAAISIAVDENEELFDYLDDLAIEASEQEDLYGDY